MASALIGLVVSSYPALRTWSKANHAETLAQAFVASQGGAAHPQLVTALTAFAEALRETDSANRPTGSLVAEIPSRS